ncbi:uncharacterized protein A1O5_02398 [Cladophialophora psammophila CBS 110553]|uniref:Uncharacterized protein n=1 Tax=Cladophialophora psammophila CBS 110553 TaxID=1182543 RepID=W9XV07_9EURO|nr:uncharacterized protein A1O5_02398 [Cladophialophora psammophila CBS 110553]EXJ74104.1 hypothetical protein A1O5_02398 [Cladophialophora psammophila CBS 110553]
MLHRATAEEVNRLIDHEAAMFAATYLLRNHGFHPNVFMIFGFWTMRPRATVFTLLFFIISRVCFGQKGNENTYLWSLKDHTVEDTLLNIFSLPFALWDILHRPDSLDAGVYSDDPAYPRLWNSFYAIAGAGAVSAFLGVIMLGHACSSNRRQGTGEILYSVCRTAFVINAGTDFCPGSVVGEGIVLGVALFIIALVRPIIGGPDSS